MSATTWYKSHLLLVGILTLGCYSKANEEDLSRDGYYDSETPPDWVDYFFIVLIALHHLDYLFKITDYSLASVTMTEHQISTKSPKPPDKNEVKDDKDDIKDDKDDTKNDEDQKDDDTDVKHEDKDDTKLAPEKRKKSMIEQVDILQIFTTQQNGASSAKHRPMHHRICCCFRFYPRFFTWDRTRIARWCFKIYFSISCLLSMVLYAEFFMNLFAEYLITCITHWEQGYIFALVVIPMLLYVVETLLRLSWQSVVISWWVNCDKNGELEAKDKRIETMDTIRNLVIKSRKNISYTFTNYDDVINATPAIELGGYASVHHKADSSVPPNEPLDIDSTNENKDEYRARMGDYFMSTCWRAGFFVYTMIFAGISSWQVEVEVDVNGLFFQLVMRYAVLGGIVWSMVYSGCAILIAIFSRFKSWDFIHDDIPRWKLFFLVDAHDMEKRNGAWTCIKMSVMMLSLIIFIASTVISYMYADAVWSSFLHFIGVIFAIYYLINLFLSCKPYALVALWTDDIPPPSRNYHAHMVASEELRKSQVEQNNVSLDKEKTNTTTIAIKSKLRKAKSFRTQRADNISQRYDNFKYEYKICNRTTYSGSCFTMSKTKSFLQNYETYWLNVYRPFDEYDIETGSYSSRILSGFQWMRVCVDRKRRKRGKRKISRRMKSCFKFVMNNCCNICLLITGIAFMFALFSASQKLSGNAEASESVIYEEDQTAFYGVCSDSWGDVEDKTLAKYDLTVLDITMLAQITYEADNYNLCEIIEDYFNGQFKIMKIHTEEPFYFHIRHINANIDIIAIRGTDSVMEMMQDLSLFIEVVIFETLQWIVPFLNAFPTSFMRQIIYYAGYVEGVINADARSRFDEPIIEYAEHYLDILESNCSNDTNATTLYFVGHSLGGAIAQIAAAKILENNEYESHIMSFGVCSPGLLLSSAKFGFGIESLDKTSSSILPRRDVVSKIDSHGGSIQYTECDADSMLKCHKTDNVLCELFYGCSPELANSHDDVYEANDTYAKLDIYTQFCNDSASGGDVKAQIGKSMEVDENDKNGDVAEECVKDAISECNIWVNTFINNCEYANDSDFCES